MKSLAGEPCIVRTSLEGEVKCTVPMKRLANGDCELDLRKGGEAILYTGGRIPTCDSTRLAVATDAANPFGFKRGAKTE